MQECPSGKIALLRLNCEMFKSSGGYALNLQNNKKKTFHISTFKTLMFERYSQTEGGNNKALNF